MDLKGYSNVIFDLKFSDLCAVNCFILNYAVNCFIIYLDFIHIWFIHVVFVLFVNVSDFLNSMLHQYCRAIAPYS